MKEDETLRKQDTEGPIPKPVMKYSVNRLDREVKDDCWRSLKKKSQ